MKSIRRVLSSFLLAGLAACVGEPPETTPPLESPAGDSIRPAPVDTVMARDTATPASF